MIFTDIDAFCTMAQYATLRSLTRFFFVKKCLGTQTNDFFVSSTPINLLNKSLVFGLKWFFHRDRIPWASPQIIDFAIFYAIIQMYDL